MTSLATKPTILCCALEKETAPLLPRHRFGVSAARWFPQDTGAFYTGSFDGTVALWDTNDGSCVTSTSFNDTHNSSDNKVYNVSVPKNRTLTAHGLVACCTSDPRVRLWDPSSGALTHSLVGHRDAVWTSQWSKGSEWVLLTGGGEGDIRVWDIRRAGAFMSLDASDVLSGDNSRLDPIGNATSFPESRTRIEFAPPTAPTRRMEDNIPEHLRSMDARVAYGSYGGRRSQTYKGGAYGNMGLSAGEGGGEGGGGWGMGFRAMSGRGSGATGSNDTNRTSTGTTKSNTDKGNPVGRAHAGRVTALTVSPDGLRVASAGTDNVCRVWDLGSGRNENLKLGTALNDVKKATSLAFDQTGDRLYFPSSDGSVLIFDVCVDGNGERTGAGDDSIEKNDVDDDQSRGTRCGGCGGRNTVRSVGRNTNTNQRSSNKKYSNKTAKNAFAFSTLRGHLAAACAVAVHPDTQEVFTGGADRHVLVWRAPVTASALAGRRRKIRDEGEPRNGRSDDGSFAPFRASAESRNRATLAAADEDDWSEDDLSLEVEVNPDPRQGAGIHGLGYRRRFDE